jgi:lipoprotein LprG
VNSRRLHSARPRAVAAALLVALAAGCGGSSGPSAKELVSESVAKTAAVRTFHLVIDVEHVPTPSTGLGLTFVDGDVVVPDKLRGRVGGTFLGIALSSELVVVGDQYFLKIPFTGKWRTIDVATLPSAFFDPEQGILAVIDGATDVTRDGSEDVGGVPTYRLKAKVRADSLKPLLNTAEGSQELPIELWIGKDDLLLRRLRLSGPVSPDEGEDAVRTVELSAFDEPVQISAPDVS